VLAKNVDYNVVWVPMREDVRAKFNEKAAQDFFF